MSKRSTCFAMSRRAQESRRAAVGQLSGADWTSGPGANRSVLWVAERAKTWRPCPRRRELAERRHVFGVPEEEEPGWFRE